MAAQLFALTFAVLLATASILPVLANNPLEKLASCDTCMTMCSVLHALQAIQDHKDVACKNLPSLSAQQRALCRMADSISHSLPAESSEKCKTELCECKKPEEVQAPAQPQPEPQPQQPQAQPQQTH